MLPLGPALVLAAGANDPGLVEACGPKAERSWLCSSVYRITGDETAADVADALAKPLRIVLILVVAFLVVLLSRVIINRFVRHLSGGVERLAGIARRSRDHRQHGHDARAQRSAARTRSARCSAASPRC